MDLNRKNRINEGIYPLPFLIVSNVSHISFHEPLFGLASPTNKPICG